MKTLLLAAGIAAATIGTASASVITWDFTGFTGGAVNAPVYGNSNLRMLFGYNSQSVVVDVDGDGVLSDGDTIHSYGGFGSNGFDSLLTSPLTGSGFDSSGANFVSGFRPDGNPMPDSYGSADGYLFTFFFNDLQGVYNSSAGGFIYTSGTITFGLYSNSLDTGFSEGFHSLFNMDVSFGGPSGSSEERQNFRGTLDPSSFANGAGESMFLSQGSTTRSFNEWAALESTFYFNLNQTVEGGLPGLPTVPSEIEFNGQSSVLIAAEHAGQVTFSVPEPASIAILGAGLLGMGFVGRRRRKAA